MAEELLYDQVDAGGDPDPLGLRKRLAASKSTDPLGLRARISVAKESSTKTDETFKPAFDWLNVDQGGYKPISQENVVNEHTIKMEGAANRVKLHLQDIDQSVHNLLYEHKKNLAGIEKSNELAISRPLESAPINPQAQALEHKLRKDVYVSPVEVDSYKSTLNSPGVARQVLQQKAKDLEKTNPAASGELKSDIYRLDRQSNPEKESAIEKNVDKIKNGDYDYDIKHGALVKHVGFLEGIVEGFKQKTQAYEDYGVFESGDEKQILKRIKERTEQDPDKPIAVPKEGYAHILPGGEAGMMLGGQPLKPIIGSGVVGYFGGPQAGAAVMAAMSAPEMYKLNFGAALPRNYADIKKKSPNISDTDALRQAMDLTNKQSVIDAATGAAMGALGGKLAFKPVGLGKGLLEKSVGSALTQIGEVGAKKALEGLGVGAIGATGQAIKNIVAQKSGLSVDETQGVADQLKAGALMTVGMHVAAKLPNLLKPKTYNELFNAISKQSTEVIDSHLSDLQQSGQITPEEASVVQGNIQQQKEINASIRGNVSEAERLKIQEKIKQRDAKEKELETAHKAYHPQIKEEIKKLDEEIVNLSNGSDRSDLRKLVVKEVGENNVHESAADLLMSASEKELDNYMKDISDLAHNPDTEQATIASFGKNIVEKAKELYPQTKIAENAIQERSLEAIPLGETPGNSQEMGARIPEPGEATNAQSVEPEKGNAEEKVTSPQEQMFDLPFTVESGDDAITSIKNATTAEKAEEYGLSPAIQEAARKHKDVWKAAIKKVNKGFDTQSLVNQLKKKSRPLTDDEDALLLIHQISKEAAYDAATREVNEAGERGDEAAMAEAKIRQASIKDDLQDIYNIDKKVGTLNARGLSARQMMADRRYSLVNMEQDMQSMQNGRPLSEEQKADIQKDYEAIRRARDEYAQRIVEVEAENKALREKALENKIKRENKKERIQKNIDKIKDDLRANFDELKKIARDQGLGVNPIALEAIPVIAKATKNLAKLGITKVEQIATNIYDAIKDEYGDKLTVDHVMEAIEAANNKARLDAYKANKERAINKITEKINTENAEQKPPKPPLILDSRALKLKATEERAKAAYDEKLKRQELKNRTPFQKAQDVFVKWERAFKLSGITTLGKLTGAGITRLITSPIEEGIGSGWGAILPKVAQRTEAEGGLNIKAEAKAITSAFTKGLKDAGETIRSGKRGGKGKSDLDIIFGGKKDALPPEAIDFFGQLHSAIKAPIKRAAFERSFEKRIARNLKNGVDVSDPLVQSRIAMESYKDGQRAIFMQDNFVSDSYRNWINSLEKSKKYPATGKAAATFFQWMVPFVKVPTNIVGEVGMHTGGIPIGAAKMLHATFTKGLENLTPEEADMVMRNLKKGTIGAGALLLGYFNPNNFGGYYQKFEKRKEGDIEAGEARVFGTKIPKWLLHSPIFETMQLGATVRRMKDKVVHGRPEGIEEGIWAGMLGLAEEEPLVETPMKLFGAVENSKERKYYLGELAKSSVVPILLQNIAKWTDPEEKRKPESIWEHIETGIPGLREEVSPNKKKASSGKVKKQKISKSAKIHK